MRTKKAPVWVPRVSHLYLSDRKTLLYTSRDNIFNVPFHLLRGEAIELLVDFPLVEERAEWHKPDFALRPVEKGHTIKNQSGKQFLIAYPADPFFELSSSLWTKRRVPLYIDVIIASLYAARSSGEVKSSTASCVRIGRLSSGF